MPKWSARAQLAMKKKFLKEQSYENMQNALKNNKYPNLPTTTYALIKKHGFDVKTVLKEGKNPYYKARLTKAFKKPLIVKGISAGSAVTKLANRIVEITPF